MPAGTTTVVDTSTNTVLTTIADSGFRGLAVNPSGTLVYSSNGTAGKVIDAATNTVAATITFPNAGASLNGIALNPSGTRAYYTDSNNGRLYVVDTATNTVIANIPVGTAPDGVSVTPDGLMVYVANAFSGSVSVIDALTNTVIATISTGGQPLAFGNFIGGASAGPPPATTANVPIPTLSQSALFVLIALVILACSQRLRRRP